MASSITSKNLSFAIANRFIDSFVPTSIYGVGYVYISHPLPWANEASPDIATDTYFSEREIWDGMIAAKKITSNDVEYVIPRNTWSANVFYRQYDDTIELEELTSANASQNLNPFYVINSENNVYKCLSNGASSLTNEEPSGENLASNGVISTSDGYIWKYLYNVDVSNKFLSNNWIPVPTSVADLEYSASSNVTVQGELTTIVIEDSGSGYIDSTVQVAAFNTACSILTVSGAADFSNTIFVNMSVSGNGIVSDTYITNIQSVNRTITLSFPTTSSGGASGNLVSISTRVVIEGNGSDAIASATITNNSVSEIVVSNYGINYTWANVRIYGTATGANVANARAIISPSFGHGYNAAKELGGHNAMISLKIGEVDTTEGGIISANSSFRQYGLLSGPYKYNDNVQVSYANANTVISQTHDVALISGSEYNDGEFVYQGSFSSPTFSGYVETQTASTVRLTNVRGIINIGTVLKGPETNPTGRTVFSIDYPEFQPYKGDVFYNENIEEVQREDGQAENIKFVVKF